MHLPSKDLSSKSTKLHVVSSTRTHTCTHARMHARTHARTHTRTHARTYACTHARTHARTHTIEDCVASLTLPSSEGVIWMVERLMSQYLDQVRYVRQVAASHTTHTRTHARTHAHTHAHTHKARASRKVGARRTTSPPQGRR